MPKQFINRCSKDLTGKSENFSLPDPKSPIEFKMMYF